MKNKKIFIIIIIIFSLIFLISSGIFIYQYFNNKNVKNNDNNTIEKENEKDNETVEERKQLSIENSTMLDKYSKIKNIYNFMHQKDWFFPNAYWTTLELYYRDITKSADLSNELKASFSLYNEYNYEKREEISQLESTPYYSYEEWDFDKCILNDNHSDEVYKLGCGEKLYLVFNITQAQIKKMVNSYFGDDNNYVDQSVYDGTCTVELHFNSNTNMYKLYTGGGCGGTGSLLYGYYSYITKIEEKDKEIYLYEKILYASVENVEGISLAKTYDVKDGKLIGNDSYSDNFTIEEVDKISYDLFKKYDSDLREYKYTFKQNEDGNYYFYSIELVK
jgi:hypothetical protein